jgi:hypothetical protein
MSSLQDLLVGDLNARNLGGEKEVEHEDVLMDLDYVEKVAQSVEGVLEAIADPQSTLDESEKNSLKELLLQKVAEVKGTPAVDPKEQETEELRTSILQKLAHLTPEVEVEPEASVEPNTDSNIKATLESWVSKVKQASVKEGEPKVSPTSVKSVFDLVGGITND